MLNTKEKEKNVEQPAYWSGVFAMTLCVFALIASEFMPVSLLTPIAVDLSISEGMVGQGIAISGAFAVITSLTISRVVGNMNRKTLLLLLTALMAVSGTIVALAQNYMVYMIGRALIGVVIGGFWSMSAAMAMRLVPPSDVPRAMAIFNSGNGHCSTFGQLSWVNHWLARCLFLFSSCGYIGSYLAVDQFTCYASHHR